MLNNEAGLLEYFVNEQSRHLKPRGTLPLAGAVISPSDEDSHTFTVNAISGEQYKLRGGDLFGCSKKLLLFLAFCHRPSCIDLGVVHYLLLVRVRIDSLSTCNHLSSAFFVSEACDAKERQHWVSRLQICTQHHTEAMGKVKPYPL